MEKRDMASSSTEDLSPAATRSEAQSSTGSPDLPTVRLEEGAMYWVKNRYGDNTDLWTVARWEVGSFWGIGRDAEISPSVICGPIPRPLANTTSQDAGGEADQVNRSNDLARDES